MLPRRQMTVSMVRILERRMIIPVRADEQSLLTMRPVRVVDEQPVTEGRIIEIQPTRDDGEGIRIFTR